MARAKKTVVIEQDEQDPIETKVLARAIVHMSDDLTAILASGLNKKAVIILVADSSGQPKYRVEAVLNALADLKKDYTR